MGHCTWCPTHKPVCFLRSGIVIFAPAGAVFIAVIKQLLRCLTSVWRVHWLPNGHGRMGRHQTAWSSMEMPWEVAPKYSRDFVETSQIVCFRLTLIFCQNLIEFCAYLTAICWDAILMHCDVVLLYFWPFFDAYLLRYDGYLFCKSPLYGHSLSLI